MLGLIFRRHFLFALFAFSLFAKNVLFRMATAHLDLFDTLCEYPGNFFVFWFGKLLPAVVIASFVYLFRKQWWTIVISLLTDLWILSNLFYFKANGLYLMPKEVMMAGNLHGFENSVLALMGWDVYVILLVSVVYIIGYFALSASKKQCFSIKCFGWVMGLSLLVDCWSNYYFNSQFYLVKEKIVPAPTFEQKMAHAWPFGLVYHDATTTRYNKEECLSMESNFAHDYLYSQSVISFLPAQWLFDYWNPMTDDVVITEEDKNKIDQLYDVNSASWRITNPQNNLLFILVESLESWPLEVVEGIHFMPYLSQLVDQEHVYYVPHVKSQIRHGISGDGQLTCMTGLLPIQNGAACVLFGENRFPNYASSFPSSVIINPVVGYWNQDIVTESYGFKKLIQPESDKECWPDAMTTDKMIDYIDTVQTFPFCALCLTIASHIPFGFGAEHPKYHLDGMPQTMIDYLNCLAYTDSCISVLVEHILNSPLSKNTTIVITVDHTAFRTNAFKDLERYAAEHSIDFSVEHNYVPLIIYSPMIGANERYEGESYQMDIYPTVCALLDSTVHVPSFGVDLRDSSSFNNRKVSEAEAYRLSDLIIRSNYFEHVRNDTIDCQ